MCLKANENKIPSRVRVSATSSLSEKCHNLSVEPCMDVDKSMKVTLFSLGIASTSANSATSTRLNLSHWFVCVKGGGRHRPLIVINGDPQVGRRNIGRPFGGFTL